MEDITGIVITIYDHTSEKELVEDIKGNLTFEPVAFPEHWIRSIRVGKYLTYWTTELSPPELGGDSAMELGLEL